MPELPEVECVRRTLAALLRCRRVEGARLARRDIAHGVRGPRDLLVGSEGLRIDRHGKQLALVGASGRALCVHLGMSGQLLWTPPGRRLARTDHVHAVWRLRTGDAPGGRLVFRDPRRFGGIWAYPSSAALLEARWSRLGPDALTISAEELRRRLGSTRRPLKSALLDQRVLAGVGNIYADEALHRAGISPLREGGALSPGEASRLAQAIVSVLRQAIDGGGSTLRDYLNGVGEAGEHQRRHRVYGRRGQLCLRCRTRLASDLIAQRMSVWCPRCQPSENHALPEGCVPRAGCAPRGVGDGLSTMGDREPQPPYSG